MKLGEPPRIGFNGNRAHFGGPLQKPRWSVLNAKDVREFYLRDLWPFDAVQIRVAQVRFAETRAVIIPKTGRVYSRLLWA